MFTLKLPAEGDFKGVELRLEHSLVSLSKWEEIYEKPFFSKEPPPVNEFVDYVEHMLLHPMPDLAGQTLFDRLTQEDVNALHEYINASRTATTFRADPNDRGTSEIVTSELIYYWLIQFKIPFEPCSHWHLNRLLTLVKVCGVKQAKPKKMNKQQQAEYYRNLNAERRAALGTTG